MMLLIFMRMAIMSLPHLIGILVSLKIVSLKFNCFQSTTVVEKT